MSNDNNQPLRFNQESAQEYIRYCLVKEWAYSDPKSTTGAETRAKIEHALGLSGAEIYVQAIAQIEPPLVPTAKKQ